MCNKDPNPAYSFLQPRYNNYLKAYVYALRYVIAMSQLGGVKVEDAAEQTSALIDLLDEVWKARVQEAERHFGKAVTAEAIALLEAEEPPPSIEALMHEPC